MTDPPLLISVNFVFCVTCSLLKIFSSVLFYVFAFLHIQNVYNCFVKNAAAVCINPAIFVEEQIVNYYGYIQHIHIVLNTHKNDCAVGPW